MTGETFLTYQKFNDQAAAAELALLFGENRLDFRLEDSSLNFDASFSFNELDKEFRVKLKSEDFAKADQLLNQVALVAIKDVEEDYYLYQFTDEELINLIIKADEWSAFDVVLAKQILKAHGSEFPPEKIERLKAERLTELSTPEEISRFWLYAGYLLAFFAGLIGLFIGWHLAYHKKVLPNGTRIDSYSLKDRNHGYWMMFLGAASFLAYTIFTLFK